MLVNVPIASYGSKWSDDEFLSREGLKSIRNEIEKALKSQTNYRDGGQELKVFIAGRGYPPQMSQAEYAGTVVGSKCWWTPNKGPELVEVAVSLMGIGATFHSQPARRRPEYVPFGKTVKTSEKRIWYMPWKKKKWVDEVKIECVLMVVNTD